MIRTILRVCLGLWLAVGLAGSARALPAHSVGPVHPTRAVVTVQDSPVEGLNEIFRMDPPRLAYLGAGIVAGALFVAPGLGVNEVLGVVLGIIGGEFLYHTTWEPRHASWF